MTSNQILYFLAIVKYKTFTLAAEELYISQSSLSKQIKSLEEELNYPLFIREGNENILTENGKIFLEYAQNFSENYSKMLNKLNDSNLPKKSVSLGILPVMTEYNIHNDLALFQSLIASSDVYINLIEDMQDTLINMLKKGKIDAAIVRSDFLNLDSYKHIPIIEEELKIVYSEKLSTFNENEEYTLSDLANHPFIAFERSSALYRLIDQLFKDENMAPHYTYLYQRHSQILSMVNAGFGVTVMPEKLIDQSAYSHIRVASFQKHYITTTSLITLKNMPLSKSLSLLFQYFDSSNK